jgi:hypothetical protein
MLDEDVVPAISNAILADDVNKLAGLLNQRLPLEPDELGPWLILAVSEGRLKSTVALLQLGANVNFKNEDDETPLSFACANNELEIAKLLYESGANVNAVDAGGATPLDWAVSWSAPEFREWLRSVGGVRNTTSAERPWPRNNG